MGYFEDQEKKFSENLSNATAEAGMSVPAVRDMELSEEEKFRKLCERYKAQGMQGKMYVVTTNLSQDDDMDRTLEFLFREPKAASYDRYVKTANVSSSKAMRTFVLDNICTEQKEDLEKLLGDYPAMGISLGEKLLYMLGLSKTTTVRRL